MNRPLEGIRIIDLTAYLSGPYTTLNLAAMGAEVIKIERPGVGDPCRWNPPYAGPQGISFQKMSDEDISLLYLKRNRDKKSLFLDMRQEKGKEIFKKLIDKSDVVIENFTPGAMKRLGFDYPNLKEINPRIIYASIAGYGQDGPKKDRAAFDLTIQAMSGIMCLTGFPEGQPLRCGAWIGDMISSLYCIIGILAALRARETTGVGERIDISMQDSGFSMVTDEAHDYNIQIGTPTRTGNRLARLAPWNSYPAKDGYVIICVANNNQWENFLEAIGREDLKSDSRFKDQQGRYKNSDEVENIVYEWIQNLTRDEALDKLRAKSIPCDPIPEFDEVLQDTQLQYRDMIQNVLHPKSGDTGLKAANFPVKFGQMQCEFKNSAPYPGGNTEILSELLGMSLNEIEDLKNEKII